MRNRASFCFIILALLFLPGRFLSADPAPKSYAKIDTAMGDIWIELNGEKAPRAVQQFNEFVKDKVYEKSAFHSSEGNGINGGKPGPKAKGHSGNGNFSSTVAPAGEFELECDRATIGFSRTMGDCNPTKTNNTTQFFIQHTASPTGGKEFTIFGKVVSGIEVLDKIYEHLSRPDAQPVEMSIKLSATPPTT